jgi:hypothetical protein
MSEMSSLLKKATAKIIRLADDEGFHIVGYAVPKDLDDDFGWSLFTSCTESQANELTITIGDILRSESIKHLN